MNQPNPQLKKDYTGQNIGTRKILKFSHFTKHRDPMWQVQCQCGNVFESLTQDLKRNTCRACVNRHRRKRPFESLYNTFCHKAAKRFAVFISYEEFVTLTEQRECHYCGSPVDWLEYQTKVKGQPYRGQAYNLDRKDNTKPYTIDNVVVCCARCNLAKNQYFSYDEWKQLGEVIKTWRK